MQESRNKRQFFFLLALTLITLGVYWWIQPQNRLDIDRDLFQVEDLSTVSRVQLAHATGEKDVNLVFDGAQWKVNGEYRADGDMIRVLFATLQQARPKRAVATMKKDSILSTLRVQGVKVSLFQGEVLLMEFLAGGNEGKTQAYFADPVSEEVYLMTIPGYRVYVSGILELPVTGWRDKFVFNFNWRNFQGLSVAFPESPPEGFTVSMKRNQFGIDGLSEPDTTKLNNFLDAVFLLTVDEYVPEPGLIDSLRKARPTMAIEVRDVANRSYSLELFADSPGDRVPGLVHGQDAAFFDRRKVDYLLKPRSFFRKK